MVCRAWEPRSRYHLFSGAVLHDRQSLVGFSRFLSTQPAVADCIQSVTIRPQAFAQDQSWVSIIPSTLAACMASRRRFHSLTVHEVNLNAPHPHFPLFLRVFNLASCATSSFTLSNPVGRPSRRFLSTLISASGAACVTIRIPHIASVRAPINRFDSFILRSTNLTDLTTSNIPLPMLCDLICLPRFDITPSLRSFRIQSYFLQESTCRPSIPMDMMRWACRMFRRLLQSSSGKPVCPRLVTHPNLDPNNDSFSVPREIRLSRQHTPSVTKPLDADFCTLLCR